MIIERNKVISKLSTMRLVAKCSLLYTPESQEELLSLLQSRELGAKFYFLGAGSNVIFEENITTPIVNLMSLNNNIKFEGGLFECGCSVRTQKFIRYAQEKGYGGVEFLFSLPASMGGVVYMNAGRGGKFKNQQIVHFLEEVTYLDCKTFEVISEGIDKTQFAHHVSPYQQRDCVILSCKFRLLHQSKEMTEKKIMERIDYCRRVHDTSRPNCGSAFSFGNRFVFKLFQRLGVKSGGACFSKKTSDWISNSGNATAKDVKKLLNKMIFAHKVIGAKYKIEYKFFD